MILLFFSATGVFREFFTKPLMIDLTVGGEKAGQIIAQDGKTLLTPGCSFQGSGEEIQAISPFSVKQD